MRLILTLLLFLTISCANEELTFIITMDDVCLYQNVHGYYEVNCGPSPAYLYIEEQSVDGYSSYHYDMAKYHVDGRVRLVCDRDKDIIIYVTWSE